MLSGMEARQEGHVRFTEAHPYHLHIVLFEEVRDLPHGSLGGQQHYRVQLERAQEGEVDGIGYIGPVWQKSVEESWARLGSCIETRERVPLWHTQARARCRTFARGLGGFFLDRR